VNRASAILFAPSEGKKYPWCLPPNLSTNGIHSFP
jgi:hypothetical protein